MFELKSGLVRCDYDLAQIVVVVVVGAASACCCYQLLLLLLLPRRLLRAVLFSKVRDCVEKVSPTDF